MYLPSAVRDQMCFALDVCTFVQPISQLRAHLEAKQIEWMRSPSLPMCILECKRVLACSHTHTHTHEPNLNNDICASSDSSICSMGFMAAHRNGKYVPIFFFFLFFHSLIASNRIMWLFLMLYCDAMYRPAPNGSALQCGHIALADTADDL